MVIKKLSLEESHGNPLRTEYHVKSNESQQQEPEHKRCPNLSSSHHINRLIFKNGQAQ
jgi:hypothetical protein